MEGDAIAKVLDPLELLRRGPAHHAVDLVTMVEEQLRKVGAVLPGDPGEERARHRVSLPQTCFTGSSIRRRAAPRSRRQGAFGVTVRRSGETAAHGQPE